MASNIPTVIANEVKQSPSACQREGIASQARNNDSHTQNFSKSRSFPVLCLLLLVMISCSSSREMIDDEDLNEAEISVSELLEFVPDYRESLQTISGNGRAFVSEPGNSERVALQFLSNRNESLITVRTSVGIEGGQIYVDSDSLLVYNRVDKYAEKVPLNQGKLTSVGSIASVNMLDLFNFTFLESDVEELYESDEFYVAVLVNGGRIQISKESGRVVEVNQLTNNRTVPYSRIIYEGYAQIEGFQLPRKITIFSQDGQSRATLLVQNLEINEELPELGIELPGDIPIYR
ncbi:DUF4292 domain-containing protein [Rhodohalobacter sp. 614A]|uniref:DUF4292 domain-containing protein n=1 Tax=Rhodohalobacter sp. 614A TaxID=2908649 RepID=UPI001F375D65|nr:DUF4292 domain-containing protein [Rhodohalobacter sp. 614A]